MKEEYEEISILDPTWTQEEKKTISEKCRACTRLLADVRFNLLETSLFSELFIRLSTTQLDPGDLLPKSICPDCFQRLKDVNSFQKKCIESYTTLLENILANDLKQESSDAEHISVVETEHSASNPSRLLEFEEVLVAFNIKSENDIDSEDETLAEKAKRTNQKTDQSDQNDVSLQTKKTRQTSRKRQRSTKKRVCERDVENGNEATLHVCEKCSSQFNDKIHYEEHLLEHQGKKSYPCQECPREYTLLPRLKQHILLEHTGDRTTICACTVEGCNRKYLSQQALENHLKNIHFNPRPKRYRKKMICETCGKCLSLSGIRSHEMMHNGIFPYSCDKCPKKFRHSHQLGKHKLKLHSNLRQYSCSECGLKKATKEDLDLHMNVHTREKQYPCQYCESSFLTNANRLRHVQVIHKGIKKFHCTYCNESFGQSITLRHHMMVHTGEKPYKCPYCEKRFRQKFKVKVHARIHEARGDVMKHTEPEKCDDAVQLK